MKKVGKAVNIYNKYFDNDIIKEYEQAKSFIFNYNQGKKRIDVFYKSSKLFDYFIFQPYFKYEFTDEGVIKKNYSYDFHSVSNNKNKPSSGSLYCLGLCNLTEKEIKRRIDKEILIDNKGE